MSTPQFIQIKIEPTDQQYDEEHNLKNEQNEEIISKGVKFTNYYEDVKQETPDSVNIKCEPEDYDDTCDDDTFEPEEHILPDICIEIGPSAYKQPEGNITI